MRTLINVQRDLQTSIRDYQAAKKDPDTLTSDLAMLRLVFRDFIAERRAMRQDIRPRFVCSWEQPDNPTKGMRQAAMLEHYKRHSVAGDARFATRAGADTPEDIRQIWSWVLFDIDRQGKETAAHLATRDSLRTCTRRYLAGQTYQLPELEAPKATRKPARAALCPHCGKSIAA